MTEKITHSADIILPPATRWVKEVGKDALQKLGLEDQGSLAGCMMRGSKSCAVSFYNEHG